VSHRIELAAALPGNYAPATSVAALKQGGDADHTAAFNRAISAGVTRLLVPASATPYVISSTITLPTNFALYIEKGATVQAGATIAGPMFDTNVAQQGKYWIGGGGTIDCNQLAQNGLYGRWFLQFDVAELRIINATSHFAIFGDPAAAGASINAFIRQYDTDAPSVAGTLPAVVSGAIGLWMRNMTDYRIQRATVIGADIGFRLDGGGGKVWAAHAYGHFTRKPTDCFQDNTLGTEYISCHADSPTRYGFNLAGFNTRIIGCGIYANSDTVDNTIIGIHQGTTGFHTLLGLYYATIDGSHRIAQDIDGDPSTSTISGWQLSNVVTKYTPATTPVVTGSSTLAATAQAIIRAAAGQARELLFQSGTLGRWRIRTDNTAESGSNAGSDLRITSLDDAGSFIADIVTLSRRFSTITLGGVMNSFRHALTTKSADYTLAVNDRVVLVSATSTQTLPSATVVGSGHMKTIRNTSGAGTVTVASTAGTIDSASTATLTAGQKATYVSDGGNWWSM
jgi:hypothetical protein